MPLLRLLNQSVVGHPEFVGFVYMMLRPGKSSLHTGASVAVTILSTLGSQLYSSCKAWSEYFGRFGLFIG